MRTITYKPIGIIRTPFKKSEGTPIQASAACGVKGMVEIFPEYSDGSKGNLTNFRIQEMMEDTPDNEANFCDSNNI
jgi:tRNA (Thr-GGU) A37 N-methylase